MNQHDAIQAADHVAGVAYSGDPHPFLFSEIVGVGPLTMPEFLDRHRGASPSWLYNHCCRMKSDPVSLAWDALPANVRCAFEVYRATYSVLMKMVRETQLAERETLFGKLDGHRVVRIHGVKRAVRRCRVCGCTDDDCSQCVAKTGKPCHWVESDLCSACVAPATKAG